MRKKEQAILEPKLVNDIEGEFLIPAYQRGYRWEKEHILMLLNDIWKNGDNNYSLQPLVVKKLSHNYYELIDGQQRTTTLLLILKYMKQVLPFIELNFSLSYETRPRSEEFLNMPTQELANDNIDFFHIYNAYETIDEWFSNAETGDRNLKCINLYKYFGERVKVIWYEVDTGVDSIELFTRLNIGKIPLTNAELVKALFLSKDDKGFKDHEAIEEKQLEISTSWDLMERELHNDNFWYFLTNQSPDDYATRIELIFNLMANKDEDEREKFFTFYYFSDQMNSKYKTDIWTEIKKYFSSLKEWYEKRSIYHKVGFLVAIGKSMQSIIEESKGLTKTAFEAGLDKNIKQELDLTKEGVIELNYENRGDRNKIENVLLLHNVETTRRLNDHSMRYSFERHKANSWSLEHIHAQESEGLNKKEDQKEWLLLHKESLQNLIRSKKEPERIRKLIQKIDEHIENITKEMFDKLFKEVFECLSENEDRSYIDDITNMALLSSSGNAALNNSTFDVKRNRILEMDKSGEYIPICTRRIFLKYYTNSINHQLHYWGEEDRKAYLNSMVDDDGMLAPYLKEEQKVDHLQ